METHQAASEPVAGRCHLSRRGVNRNMRALLISGIIPVTSHAEV